METKKVEIEIPAGKEVKWVNGVLTLVDEKPKDVTERIKTFEDALDELGEEHPYVVAYRCIEDIDECGGDIEAYLKLRIIAAALNEGWNPQFTEDECRWYPWFCLYTQKEIDEMDEDERLRCVLRSGDYSNAFSGLAYANAFYASSYSNTYFGARLAFRNEELAAYAGRHFAEIYADLCFKPTTEE